MKNKLDIEQIKSDLSQIIDETYNQSPEHYTEYKKFEEIRKYAFRYLVSLARAYKMQQTYDIRYDKNKLSVLESMKGMFDLYKKD